MNNYKVVVIGVDHFNTLGIIRSLGECGITPIAVILSNTKQKAWTLKSRYLDKTLSCVASPENTVSILERIGEQLKTLAYILPSCDAAVKILDENYDRLSSYYIFPSIYTQQQRLSCCLDKTYVSKVAQSAGFLIPKTICLVADNKEQVENVKLSFKGLYPLIIKDVDAVKGKSHTKIVYDENELQETLNICGIDKIIIQPFIIKDEELGIQGVGLGDKMPIIPATIHKIRTSVDSIGSTTYATIVDGVESSLKDKCEKFIRSLLYSGIFDIEVLRKENDFFFIECNFRNGAYGYAYTKMGYNLPYIWITGLYPKDTPMKKTLFLMNAFNDIKHIRVGTVNVFRWIKEFIRTDIMLTFNKKDVIPFIYRAFLYLDDILLKLHK